jgi:hypothetical protein
MFIQERSQAIQVSELFVRLGNEDGNGFVGPFARLDEATFMACL